MTQSEQLFEKSEHFLPGGVNSPVRAFRNVGGTPVFVKSGKGSHILDEDSKFTPSSNAGRRWIR